MEKLWQVCGEIDITLKWETTAVSVQPKDGERRYGIKHFDKKEKLALTSGNDDWKHRRVHSVEEMESSTNIEFDFRSRFNDCYNKSGKDRLRCFPKCCDTGHIERGFCGNSVVGQLSFRYGYHQLIR
jgi:hypothetical protein